MTLVNERVEPLMALIFVVATIASSLLFLAFAIERRNGGSSNFFKAFKTILQLALPRSGGKTLLPMLLATGFTMFALIMTIVSSKKANEIISFSDGYVDQYDIEKFRKELELSYDEVKKLSRDLSSKSEGKEKASLVLLEKRLSDLEKKSIAFEGLILSKPEQLVTLPILSRDLEGIRSEQAILKQQLTVQTQLIQETNSQNRWVIGTIGLGLLALLYQIVRTSKEEKVPVRKKRT